MGDSVYFGNKAPDRRHLVRGSGGLAGEIKDLRGDMDEALVALEDGGMVRADIFTDPPAADPDGVKLSFSAATSDQTFRTADFDGAEGAAITGGARAITVARSAAVGDYQFADDIIIKGKAYGEDVTLTFTPADADGGDTIDSNEDLGLDTIEEVIVPADPSTDGAYEIGFGVEMVLFRGIKDLAGVSTPLREVEAGAVVTTGTFSGRKYTVPVNVPNGARDYAVVYVADPAV